MEKTKSYKPRKGISIEVNGVRYPSVRGVMESNGLKYNSAVYERFMDDTGMHFKTAMLSDKKDVEAWLEKYIEKRKNMSDRRVAPVEVFGKVYKSKKDAFMKLKLNCTYEKFLAEIRKYDCDTGKAIEKLLKEDFKNLEMGVEVLGMRFGSRNKACRQLGVNTNTAEMRGKRGFCLIDSIFGKPKKGRRYLTDAMVKGIIGNRLVQGYDYNEACDIVFDDAEAVIETAMLEKIAKFKEAVERSKKDGSDVFLIYLKIFEGCVDFTKLGKMVCERSKFQVNH